MTDNIEGWKRSVDKTLTYYKDKVKTLKTNSKSRLKKLQTSWQREKRVLNNKIRSLETKNEELNVENILLCKKLKDLQNMGNININIHKIFDYGSKSKKNTRRNSFDSFDIKENEIKNTTNQHSLRLAKWMKNTEILMEMDKTNKKLLLNKYSDYKQLMAQQESKMEDISNYISDLIAQKRKLKQRMKSYEIDIGEKNKLYCDSFISYNKMREKRNDLYNLMLESVDRLNEIIDDENELNEKKCKLYSDYNNFELEFKECKDEINHCSFLIKQYQKFDKINDEKINEIKKYFALEWKLFMKEWFKWDYKSIICWIKYLIAENQLVLSSNINLNQIEIKMKNYGVSGIWFQQIDKNELKDFGFIKLNDRQQIYNKIKELIKNNNYSDEGLQEQIEGKKPSNYKLKINIPTQFLCPITKQIMMEPVQFVIDDYTYEKAAILSYLKKYHKSPITNEKCDDDDDNDEFILVPNRKLAQNIQTFLYINPNIFRDKSTNYCQTSYNSMI